jgi:hypothetical protein
MVLITAYIKDNNLIAPAAFGSYVAVTAWHWRQCPNRAIGIGPCTRARTFDGKVFDLEQQQQQHAYSLRAGPGPGNCGLGPGVRPTNKGSKAVLLIPSELAHKGTSPSPSIPAHAVLRPEVTSTLNSFFLFAFLETSLSPLSVVAASCGAERPAKGR